MPKRKGFTLIELMIVVVIIGLLAALAIPRFMRAAKKSKLAERKEVLKSIWTAGMSYYEEFGEYPGFHQFNDASTKNNDWVQYPGISVSGPSGFPRFSYYMSNTFEGEFYAYAYAYIPDSWDASLVYTNDMIIHQNGTFEEDAAPYEPE